MVGDLIPRLRERRGDFDKRVLFEENAAGFVVDLTVDAEEVGVRVCVCCAAIPSGVSVGLGFEEVGIDVIADLAWKL